MSQDIISKIYSLKKQHNAIILAHNYQPDEVQDIADFVGDSLGLSQMAAKTDAEVVVFCGVLFMAEVAKILSPDKKVIMPDIHAGCPMANMITLEQLKELKAKHTGAVTVCYINTNSDVKTECDICCTSGNALKVVASIPKEKEIIFVPDQYLGSWIEEQLDRKMILWNGYCHIHMQILPEFIVEAMKKHPEAEVLVHPECTPAVRKMADKVLGTGGMIKWAKESSSAEFIIGTENGMIHRLQKENPSKKFYAVSDDIICPNMKKITLEKVLFSLEDLKEEIIVPLDIAAKAKKCIDAMLALS